MSEIKNDVIEKQYEELKNGIKFRIENNITDDWEQHYHCIDVLCEKHKERIKDIENGICAIEKLEKQLAEKEKENAKLKQVVNCVDKLKQFNADMKNYALVNRDVADEIYFEHQDKISFAVEQLEKVKNGFMRYAGAICNEDGSIKKYDYVIKDSDFEKHIDNQIKQLKEGE